ncbi:MAG TPA: peptidoglycan recognition family protein, partial [Tepidisphaeraceae bacterium]|nr:peptidoglycan recognition family protein [Tepidisphaeraceae bacterium]
SGDGQVEVGSRWPKQKWGAHAKTPDNRFNDFGIGICLVGNFDIERPTPRQMQSLAKLTAYLMRTYNISESNVLGHRDTKPTDCPGRNLNVQLVRRMAGEMIAESGNLPTDAVQTASAKELLVDTDTPQ